MQINNALFAIEHAIQILDMLDVKMKIEPDELKTTLKELRAARIEILGEAENGTR